MPHSDAMSSPDDAVRLGRLRAIAAVLLAAGATISVGLMIRAGLRQDSSVFLIFLIGGWVAAPFAALGVAHAIAGRRPAQARATAAVVTPGRWSAEARATLAVVALVVAVGSPLIYVIDAIDPLTAKAAAVFVAVPGLAWLFMVIAAAFSLATGRRRTS